MSTGSGGRRFRQDGDDARRNESNADARRFRASSQSEQSSGGSAPQRRAQNIDGQAGPGYFDDFLMKQDFTQQGARRRTSESGSRNPARQPSSGSAQRRRANPAPKQETQPRSQRSIDFSVDNFDDFEYPSRVSRRSSRNDEEIDVYSSKRKKRVSSRAQTEEIPRQRRARRDDEWSNTIEEDYGFINRNGRGDKGGRKPPILPILLVIVLIAGFVVIANALGIIGNKNKLEPVNSGTSGVASSVSVTDDGQAAAATPTPSPEPTPEPTPTLPPLNSAYANVFPELRAEKVDVIPHTEGDKVVYLTFDDGPCKSQRRLLEVLESYDVKATFFVSRQFFDDEKIVENIKEAYEKGHGIAVHTSSHEYHEIYASVEAYLEDFNKMNELIVKATGYTNPVYRFPGGSNTGYNEDIRKAVFEEMKARNFVHYDWDVGNGDSEGCDLYGQIDRVMGNVPWYDSCIVLMHNTPDKDDTIESLHTIIPQLKEKGYRFAVLDATVPPVQFASLSDYEYAE